ncbi:MAG: hypothetical protein AAF745_06650, partial [Planctomycetota bacterium]
PDVETLRGVVVHQHGCGPGSCQSGLTGAYDLHWQALAKKHHCALVAASYEQPDKQNCDFWCDPRNGSGDAFLRGLKDLGQQAGHPELSRAPWALWGHSGGGVWSGAMTLLYPDRVAAAFLRSGTPLLETDPDAPDRVPFDLVTQACSVPIMVNLGTEEGFTVSEGRFSKVWPRVRKFLSAFQKQDGLVGVSVDPLTGHQCGNQRYLAIAWLDECLSQRLPESPEMALRPMDVSTSLMGDIETHGIAALTDMTQLRDTMVWLPSERIAKLWVHYVRDTKIPDTTAPPTPTDVEIRDGVMTWRAEADLESGIRQFMILQGDTVVATVPDPPTNPFGRPLFQGLLYSDTPPRPLQPMQWQVPKTITDLTGLQIATENTVGLRSEPVAAVILHE